MEKYKMSKTAAHAAAQDLVGRVYGSGTSYQFTAPWDNKYPNGGRTEVRSSSYWHANMLRARVVAELAIYLMGVRGDSISGYIECAASTGGTAKQIIGRIITDVEKFGTGE